MTLRYDGALKAAIFDWAGTVVDFGCRAPVRVFVEAFRRFGIEISEVEARVPMGLPKWEHIKALGMLPAVGARWQAIHGRPFTDADVDNLYGTFLPLNVEVVTEYAKLVPGAEKTVAALRARGLKIGSTTGYARQIMDALVPLTVDQGYTPDCIVCPNEVPEGRPSPLMIYKCLFELGAWPAAAAVKIDDTAPGIEEGRHAGLWTVGVTLSGNEVGLPPDDLAALSTAELAERRRHAETRLKAAGAHFVVDSVADLMPIIDLIDTRLKAGDMP